MAQRPKPVRQAWKVYIMSLEIMSTAAAIGTFLVIAATAIAAVVQLRHLRAQNHDSHGLRGLVAGSS
jgi:hypothetical protein